MTNISTLGAKTVLFCNSTDSVRVTQFHSQPLGYVELLKKVLQLCGRPVVVLWSVGLPFSQALKFKCQGADCAKTRVLAQ